MSVTVAAEAPRQPEVAALLRLSDAIAAQLYPGEPRRALNPETLDASGIHLLVARRDGVAGDFTWSMAGATSGTRPFAAPLAVPPSVARAAAATPAALR